MAGLPRTGPAATSVARINARVRSVTRPARQVRASAGSIVAATAEEAAARTEADGPAPVFQLRVSLAGSRPPIWRRLEVPADIMLDELHGVIQVAFEWDDYHPYAFVTDYGVFGPPDSALPVRSDESVTLEQVATGENATIRYLYDFDDCWEHDIAVERIVKPEPGVVYPRCASGRCAAPPEESGGMQGYLDLLAILEEPR